MSREFYSLTSTVESLGRGFMEIHDTILTTFILCLKFSIIIKRKKLWEISSVLDVLFEMGIQIGSRVYEFGVQRWK